MASEKLTLEDITKIALLSRLSPESEDLTVFVKEINSILGYMAQLSQVNVDGIQPLSHIQDAINVFREDKIVDFPDKDLALENAPDRSGRFYRVPIVIDGES